MKKMTTISPRALLCTAALLSATASYAQTSNVSIYGVISTGPQYVNDVKGGSLFALANSGMMPPRIGFKGDEDLGGGNHAIFTLENGFAIDTGAQLNGGIFGRQAFVGLKNTKYGQVTMGRQYEEMTSQLWWAESSNVFSGIGAHIGDNDNEFFTNRFNNSIRYASPNFNGWSFAGSYGFSESPDSFSNNNAYSAGTSYAGGPWKFGLAYSQFNRRGGTNTGGAVDATGWGFSSPFVTSPGGSATDRQRIVGLGLGYDFGFMKATANYTNVRFDYADTNSLKLQNGELALSTNIRSGWLVGLAYVYTGGEYAGAGGKPHWQQFNFGTLYSLSKRTDLFMTVIHQRAGGSAKYAQIYSLGQASGLVQTSTQIGIRHFF
jgi:predicted porin